MASYIHEPFQTGTVISKKENCSNNSYIDHMWIILCEQFIAHVLTFFTEKPECNLPPNCQYAQIRFLTCHRRRIDFSWGKMVLEGLFSDNIRTRTNETITKICEYFLDELLLLWSIYQEFLRLISSKSTRMYFLNLLQCIVFEILGLKYQVYELLVCVSHKFQTVISSDLCRILGEKFSN